MGGLPVSCCARVCREVLVADPADFGGRGRRVWAVGRRDALGRRARAGSTGSKPRSLPVPMSSTHGCSLATTAVCTATTRQQRGNEIFHLARNRLVVDIKSTASRRPPGHQSRRPKSRVGIEGTDRRDYCADGLLPTAVLPQERFSWTSLVLALMRAERLFSYFHYRPVNPGALAEGAPTSNNPMPLPKFGKFCWKPGHFAAQTLK